jgi:hypothetical protein
VCRDAIDDVGNRVGDEVLGDALEHLRHDRVGQVGREPIDDPRDGLLDQVRLEVLDHLLGGGSRDLHRRLGDRVADAADGCVEGTTDRAAHTTAQPCVRRFLGHACRLCP